MAGIFGVASNTNCNNELFLGTSYLQHRAQDYCGLAVYDGKSLKDITHKGFLKQKFARKNISSLKCLSGLGCVSEDRQPILELSRAGGTIFGFDGNIINYRELKEQMLKQGKTFSGYSNPEEVNDTILISKIIASEVKFEDGIEKLVEQIQGDFAITALKKEGIYAARGWGRKPLILGQKNGSYAVSSESNSFANTGFEIIRDVEPGEIVLINEGGVQSLKKLALEPVKYGTFEWVYTAYPPSIIDGREVAETREKIGGLLAKKFKIDADIVSPVPNSGRWHAIGYANESGIPYKEVFVRYDYADRSFTKEKNLSQNREAKEKLIPVRSVISGKRIILVDDSIVRGTQTTNQVKKLKELGAKEVHSVIACPPLMYACKYGKTTKKDEDCIARRMPIEKIQEILKLNSLNYADFSILEQAIGIPKKNLCSECWEA